MRCLGDCADVPSVQVICFTSNQVPVMLSGCQETQTQVPGYSAAIFNPIATGHRDIHVTFAEAYQR
jgi:hypothetical protein